MTGRGAGPAAVRAAVRATVRLLRIAAAAALIIAAAPVSLVAAGSAALAWRSGWPPGRLYRAALWCVPMLVVWLAATAVATRSAFQVAAAPYLAWLAMWDHGAAGSYPAAAAVIAPAAIPAGLAAGGLAWSYRIRSMDTGSGGLAPDSAVSFDLRQWRHQARSARARIAAPGAVPLTTRSGDLVAGAVIRVVGHPTRPIASIPYARMRSHQAVIGTTGTGNSTPPQPFATLRVGLQRFPGGWSTRQRSVAAGRALGLGQLRSPCGGYPIRRSGRLGSRLLTAQCRQPNEQSAAVDAVPLPRDQQARGGVWLRRTVQRPGMPGRCPMRTRARCLRRPCPGRSMTILRFDGGSGQAGPAFGRARSRAFSRLSAMPWA